MIRECPFFSGHADLTRGRRISEPHTLMLPVFLIFLQLPTATEAVLRPEAGLPFAGTPAFKAPFTSGNLDFFPMNKSICYLAPCLVEIFPDGTPGYPDDGSCFLLFEALEIDEFEQFELLGKQNDTLVCIGDVTLRSITPDGRVRIHVPRDSRPPATTDFPVCTLFWQIHTSTLKALS